MGKRGPAPKPTALRVLHGDRKDRINQGEPVPAAGGVEPTEELLPAARRAWDRIAPDLVRQGVLTAWDAQAFTTYCQMIAHYQEASRCLEAEGMIARGAAGGVIKSPYWQIMRDAVGVMTTIGGRFALTPADRAQLSLSEKSAQPNDDLLSG